MFLFVHRFGRGPKYEGKLTKLAYKDEIYARRAAKAAQNRAKWAAMTPGQRRFAVCAIAAIFLLIVILGSVH